MKFFLVTPEMTRLISVGLHLAKIGLPTYSSLCYTGMDRNIAMLMDAVIAAMMSLHRVEISELGSGESGI